MFTSLITKDRLQKEPILNLIHGLISFDKWYSGLPKDMQVEEFDVYNESCTISMKSDGCEGTSLADDSDDNSIDDDASLHPCSSESSINNENNNRKMDKKPGIIRPKEEIDPLGSVNEDFRSIFLNTCDGPTCGKCQFCSDCACVFSKMFFCFLFLLRSKVFLSLYVARNLYSDAGAIMISYWNHIEINK